MNQTSIPNMLTIKRCSRPNLRTSRTPARLAFANHMNRFIAGDRAPSSPEAKGEKPLMRLVYDLAAKGESTLRFKCKNRSQMRWSTI
jgi:hypothetical protein